MHMCTGSAGQALFVWPGIYIGRCCERSGFHEPRV